MKWKNRYNTEVDPQSVSMAYADVPHIRVCIHTVHGLGDCLYLNCPELNISDHNLNTANFDEAVTRSREYIWNEFLKIQKGVSEYLEDWCPNN